MIYERHRDETLRELQREPNIPFRVISGAMCAHNVRSTRQNVSQPLTISAWKLYFGRKLHVAQVPKIPLRKWRNFCTPQRQKKLKTKRIPIIFARSTFVCASLVRQYVTYEGKDDYRTLIIVEFNEGEQPLWRNGSNDVRTAWFAFLFFALLWDRLEGFMLSRVRHFFRRFMFTPFVGKVPGAGIFQFFFRLERPVVAKQLVSQRQPT